MKKQTIAIIGGGAAGMMVAATLAQKTDREGQIHLFEKNKSLGAKVIISGGGRCNLTTGFTQRKQLEPTYTRGWSFFESSLKAFTPRSVKKRFEANGVPCKIEEDMRVFPVSNDGKDVVRMFENILSTGGVDIHFSEAVQSIDKTGSRFTIISSTGTYEVDKVILTTGGNAYSHTGSTGDGYDFARGLGHTITPLGPSLNSFSTSQTWIHALSGLSFPNARIHATIDNTSIKKSGPILLTHFGISGPLTFVVASESAFETISPDSPFQMHLQPLAEMSYDDRLSYLLHESQTSKKELISILASKLPKRFCEALLAELELQSHSPISQLSKTHRQLLADQLGNGIPLSLIKRRPGDEFVTAGGVDTDEVDPQTLESKICPGLYFAGEILNIDGVTDGYNLQMCWSTGRSVGEKIK